MFYQKITNSLILCIFCSILSISFRSIRFYNIFRRNARDLGNLRNENSSLKCAADWSRPHKTSKMGESTMTEKRYLKWYNKVGYGSGDIAGNVLNAHASFRTYASLEEYRTGSSSLAMKLDGIWKFAYAKNYTSAIPGFEKTDSVCCSRSTPITTRWSGTETALRRPTGTASMVQSWAFTRTRSQTTWHNTLCRRSAV